ncbi:MAG: hypothetical protein ABIG95_02740 [Candidatus Woesearchaeota archaeon]
MFNQATAAGSSIYRKTAAIKLAHFPDWMTQRGQGWQPRGGTTDVRAIPQPAGSSPTVYTTQGTVSPELASPYDNVLLPEQPTQPITPEQLVASAEQAQATIAGMDTKTFMIIGAAALAFFLLRR